MLHKKYNDIFKFNESNNNIVDYESAKNEYKLRNLLFVPINQTLSVSGAFEK